MVKNLHLFLQRLQRAVVFDDEIRRCFLFRLGGLKSLPADELLRVPLPVPRHPGPADRFGRAYGHYLVAEPGQFRSHEEGNVEHHELRSPFLLHGGEPLPDAGADAGMEDGVEAREGGPVPEDLVRQAQAVHAAVFEEDRLPEGPPDFRSYLRVLEIFLCDPVRIHDPGTEFAQETGHGAFTASDPPHDAQNRWFHHFSRNAVFRRIRREQGEKRSPWNPPPSSPWEPIPGPLRLSMGFIPFP